MATKAVGGRALIRQIQAVHDELVTAKTRCVQLFDQMGHEWADEARDRCPVGPDRLMPDGSVIPGGSGKASIKWVLDGPTRGHLEANAYLLYVDEGTMPHMIEARPGHVLRFAVGGTTYFRPWVMHPGTQAHPFIRDAWDSGRVQNIAQQIISARVVLWRV